jgi:hypothetical protein
VANIARGGCAFAGSGEADNKTKLNWIIGNAEDDRDCCCRGLGRKRGRMAACCGNNSHAAADEVSHK